MRLNNKIITKERIRFLLVYSILFVLCFFFCFQIFFSNYNKTYMFNYDAIDNNYPFFIAVGRWWRLLFKNIFIKHTFEIPMWDMSIGYGGDIITTLGNGFNNFFNPLYIISALFPAERSETAFKIVLVLQIYFSGLAFSLLASYRKRFSKTAVMIGSLVYAFSSNTFIVFKQLSFGYILVIFPLIVLGIWMIRDKKKPYLFIVSVISVFTYSYYFTFMAVIILLVYYAFLVAESLIISKGKSFKDELMILLKLFLSSLYAGIVGIFLILPSIIALTKLDRLDLEYLITPFRDKAYSGRLVAGFVSVFDGWSDDLLGFPVLAFICVSGLFLLFGFKEEIKAKILFVIASVSLFIPYVGHILNGMSYSTNRWTWAYTLLVSFIITMVFDKLYSAKIWKLAVIIALLIGYECVLIYYFDINNPTQKVPVVLGIAIVLFTICSRLFSREDYEKIMVGITILALSVSSFFYFSPRFSGIMSHIVASGTPYDQVIRSGGKEALYIVDDDSLFRYDTMSGKLKNTSLIMGVAGYDTYNSIYNPYISQFDKDMGLTATSSPSMIDGISGRSDLEAFLGTKYIIRNADDLSNSLPYGYSQNIGHYVTSDQATYELYITGSGSSIVSFFKDSVDESYYDSLSCYDKQQLLMNAVVIPDSSSDYSFSKTESIPFNIVPGPNVSVDGNKITVSQQDSYIDLELDHLVEGNGEWYVYFKDLICLTPETRSFKVRAYCVVDPMYVEIPEEEEIEEDPEETADLEEEEEEITEYLFGIGHIYASTKTNHMYGGKDTWLVNSRMMGSNCQKVRLIFEKPSEYTFDDLSIYFEHDDQIESNISGIEHPAKDIRINGNTVTSEVSLDQAGYVLMTIPYSDGWTAKVDGKDATIIRADRAFMAFELPAGEHEIVLKYRTPYLIPGLTGAFVLIAGGIALAVLQEKNILFFKKKKV